MPAYPFTHARVLFLSAAGGLTLSACAAGNDIRPVRTPRDVTTLQPGAMIAAAAARGTGASDHDHWWQSYGDPQLDMLVSAVSEGAPPIDAALANATERLRGTSFAAPLVAGRLALRYPLPVIDRIAPAVSALVFEARDLGRQGRDKIYGHGLICEDCGGR